MVPDLGRASSLNQVRDLERVMQQLEWQHMSHHKFDVRNRVALVSGSSWALSP